MSLVVSIATLVVVWVRLGARGVVLLGKDGDGGAEAVPLPTLSPGEGGAEDGPMPTQQEGTGKGDRGTEGAGGWMAGLPIRMEGGNVVVDGDLVVRGNVSCYTSR